jgi:hypothetical protein
VVDRDVPVACETLRRMGDHLEEYLRGGDEHERVLRMLFGEVPPAAGGRPDLPAPGAGPEGPP